MSLSRFISPGAQALLREMLPEGAPSPIEWNKSVEHFDRFCDFVEAARVSHCGAPEVTEHFRVQAEVAAEYAAMNQMEKLAFNFWRLRERGMLVVILTDFRYPPR